MSLDRPLSLLELTDGGLSLEFAPSDWAFVKAALIEVADTKGVVWQQQVMHQDVFVRGESLSLWNEWDEPCLISTTEDGVRLLRLIESIATSAKSVAEARGGSSTSAA